MFTFTITYLVGVIAPPIAIQGDPQVAFAVSGRRRLATVKGEWDRMTSITRRLLDDRA